MTDLKMLRAELDAANVEIERLQEDTEWVIVFRSIEEPAKRAYTVIGGFSTEDDATLVIPRFIRELAEDETRPFESGQLGHYMNEVQDCGFISDLGLEVTVVQLT